METVKVYKTQGDGPIATFLRQNGLKEDIIPVADHNREGYLRVVRNERGGGRFFGNLLDRPVLEYKDWPKGFDYERWLALTEEEDQDAITPPDAA